MKNGVKKVKKFKYLFLVLLVVTAGAFFLQGDHGHAADEIFITYNGQDLDPSQPVQMTTSSMQLMMRTTGTPYDDDRYKVEWTIEDSAVRDVIASIEQSQTNKIIASVRALSPGNVTVTVTVKDSMDGDAVLGSTTCNINVMFAVDTSLNADIFRYVNENDTERSLVLYADDEPVQLDLNFGKASDAQWISSNEEIVTIGRNTGKLTPVGAGRT